MPYNNNKSPAAAGRRQAGNPRPSGVLLNCVAYYGSRLNTTTAVGEGRDGRTIEVSLWLAPPPLPSKLYVYCPHRGRFAYPCSILSTAEDLILFRVPMGMRMIDIHLGRPPNFRDWDFMVYHRAGGFTTPSLTRIPIPKPKIYGGCVALLPRAGNLFTAASLCGRRREDEYTLHRFDSEVGSWTKKVVSLAAPRKPYPIEIPMNAVELNYHTTTTTITLGGEAGTVGWVDLWSGILLYDLLRDPDDPAVLRHMPLPMPPLPVRYVLGERTTELCGPSACRGIASVVRHGEACLKLAGLESIEKRLPYDDIETDMPCYSVDDWAVTTWTNTNVADSADYSFEDWHKDFTVWASEITITEAVRSELLASGLLHHEPSYFNDQAVELALQNLVVSEPTPSLNGDEDVVYLMARPKRYFLKAWALAVDMNSRTLLRVSEFGKDDRGLVAYCSSAMSNYE